MRHRDKFLMLCRPEMGQRYFLGASFAARAWGIFIMVAIPVTNVQDPSYKVTPGSKDGFYDGVGYLLTATGALINHQYIVTAAHLFNDANAPNGFAAKDGSIEFKTASGTYTVTFKAENVKIHGDYNAATTFSDFAIIELDTIAPLNVDSYGLYGKSDEVGQQYQIAGYGWTGNGDKGSFFKDGEYYVPVHTLDANPTLRVGTNIYDKSTATTLQADFDNGTDTYNTFGGTGTSLEGINTPGDSGGPHFIGTDIVGITSTI